MEESGGGLEMKSGRSRAYAAASLAAKSLGVEEWHAVVIANIVVDALSPPPSLDRHHPMASGL